MFFEKLRINDWVLVDGQPQHAQHSEHPAEEYEYLLSFHKIAKVRIF